MTIRDSMSENHDCAGDAAAYVLGALDPKEAEQFRLHMASCVVCRDEVNAFERVVDELPMAAPQYAAPNALRRRVLDEVRADARTRQRAASAPRQRWSWPARLSLPMPALGAALAAVVAAVVLVSVGSSGSGTRVVPAKVAYVGASAEVRISGSHAELIVKDFPAPPAGHIYEVWFVHGKRPSPTSTLFSVTSRGGGDVGLTGSLHGVNAVLVTPERLGGSQVPTHTPVIAAQIA
jgi:anti-sigma-K factor RskA